MELFAVQTSIAVNPRVVSYVPQAQSKNIYLFLQIFIPHYQTLLVLFIYFNVVHKFSTPQHLS
jgi:hypothetical protein